LKKYAFPLIAVDAILILVSIICGVLLITGQIATWPDILNVGRDWSIGEIFNYLKWFAISAVFFIAFRKTGLKIYACFSAVFFLILMDDSLQFHEQIGSIYSATSGGNFGLNQALGEIGFWVVLGLLCLALLLSAWFRTPAPIKRKLWPIAPLFAGVVFCGLVIDMVHFFAPEGSLFGGMLLILEDGGEMIFTSLILAYTYATFSKVTEPT